MSEATVSVADHTSATAAAGASASIDIDESKEEERIIAELEEELKVLHKRLAEARASCADTDFVKITEVIPELGRLKFKVRRNLRGHLAKVTSLHWAHNSQMLITAAQDGKLMVWDGYTSNKLHAISLKNAWVLACCFSLDDRLVACGGLDNMISIFDLNTRLADGSYKAHRELTGHDGYVSAFRFLSADSGLSSSGDKTSAVWDIEGSKIIRKFEGHDNDVNAISVEQSKKQTFVSVSSDKTCKLWDIRQGSCCQTFEGHEQDVNGVSHFPNNNYAFASSSDDGSCRLWDIRADQAISYYLDDYIQCGSTSVALSKSGRLLIAGYDDFNCHVWDVLREERVGIMPSHDGRISCVGISPDGIGIATGSWDTSCIIWTAK